MSTEQDIYYAVRYAIWNGISREEFIKQVWTAWKQVLQEEIEQTDKYFKELK